MRKIVAVRRVLYDALGHFNDDDGWSMASHLAITALMALFPFLIFATTLASFLGAKAFAETAVHLVFDTWPEQIAEPIAREVVNVLTVQRSDLLTYGVLLAAFFASNGIEALRTSLNRAYRVVETRSFIFRRVQSLVFVLIATAGFLAISVLLVFAPLHRAARRSQFRVDQALSRHHHAVALRHRLDGHRARPGRRAYLAAGRAAALRRHRAGHPVHADRLACRLDDVRRLSRPLLVLCDDLCRAGLDHDRGGLPLHHLGDLHPRRRVQRRDQPLSRGARRASG